MKTFAIAAATALALSATAVTAGDLAFLGGLEYTTEAEVFEATAGVEYATNGFTFTPLVVFNDDADDLDFVNAELTVGYDVNEAVNAYVTVETDADWNHAETTLGVALRF